MKKILKRIGIVIVSLVGILLLASWIFARKFNGEFNKVYELTPVPVDIPSDSVALARGKILSVGCTSCHGEDLAGKVFFDDPTIGVLPSSNLTRAKGSETEDYTDLDFVRAIRHGLNKKGNPLMVMPSESYTHLSDYDLGSLIAYLKTLPPIERTFPGRKFTYMSQAMAGAGMFGNLFPYNVIDHDKARNLKAPDDKLNVDYGDYVNRISGCKVCHGNNLGGGKSPDPVSPPVPDISPSGNSGKWSQDQFIAFFKTGTTPEGKKVDSNFMPYKGVGALSNEELVGLYKYLQSVPAAH